MSPLASEPAPAKVTAIHGARIYTVSSGVIERGTVLVEGGKIVAVREGSVVPPGAAGVDAAGKVVMPGIVDANTRTGLRGGYEESAEVTPGVRASASVDPRAPEWQQALDAGVTTACVVPGFRNVVSGLCAVVKTSGRTLPEALLRDGVALRAAMGEDAYADNDWLLWKSPGDGLANMRLRRPTSRMGTVWELRKAFFQAKRAPALEQVLAGRLPLRIHARIENDIRAALDIVEEFRIPRVILDECVEGYRVADLIAAHKTPVVLGPLRDAQERGPEGSEPCLNTAGILAERGVTVAFGSNGAPPPKLRDWAAFAVRYGLKPETALRMVTLDAAEVAGVADRVGSLQPGKDADLLILSGDPLQVTTRVERVMVGGRFVR